MNAESEKSNSRLTRGMHLSRCLQPSRCVKKLIEGSLGRVAISYKARKFRAFVEYNMVIGSKKVVMNKTTSAE